MFKLTSKDLISNLSGNKRIMTQGLNSCSISSATTKLGMIMTHYKFPPISKMNFNPDGIGLIQTSDRWTDLTILEYAKLGHESYK